MSSPSVVHDLQQRITEMQSLKLRAGTLPTATALAELLPGGALQKGATYTVNGSTTLATALLAEASRSGEWCGIVGLPDLGIEAAARLGLALDRCVLIPDPGADGPGIVHALSGVLTVILLRSRARPREHDAERLSARLRDSGSALVVLGDWPRPHSALRAVDSRWQGLDAGHGSLTSRDLTIETRDRRGIRQHTLHFRDGRLHANSASPAARTRTLHALSS